MAPLPEAPHDSGSSHHTSDELRPVTALFADIVGSTGLGERLGPDEVKALVGECVTRMSRAVEEFGGIIQAYMGDGICAYFGVPAAHEDDPERAARAALRILEVVNEYGRDIEAAWGIAGFGVRVGINSGPTAVGMVGAASPQQVALGDATNVAARLQSSAAPGTIAVGEATYRQLSSRFGFEPLGEIAVKGRAVPVNAWRLVAGGVLQARARTGPLVGRDQEMDRLRSINAELLAGRGQVVVIVGDAGIGKTRLLTEMKLLTGEEAVWLEGACLSYENEEGGSPFVEILRAWLGVAEGDAEVAVRTRLRAKLGALLGPSVEEAIGPLARLLGLRLDLEQERGLAGLTPEELAAEIRLRYAAWAEALAATRPLVLAVEDTHWAVPFTRRLLEELLEVTERAPLLVAVTLRRDPASEGWRFRTHASTEFSHRSTDLLLGPLADADVERLISMLMPMGLDDEAKKQIAHRAEGNPLYVEEILRAVADAAGADRKRTWSFSVTSADLPPAVENLLVARIDRLPEAARHLAQVAAVIGRTFALRLVERVAQDPDLQKNLSQLLRSEIVREVRRFPELEFTFGHGLLLEAALSTLTPARRKDLYGAVGRAYEAMVTDSPDDHLEALAFYFYRSDQPAKALEYLERAADRAIGIGAAAHAEELLGRALRLAPTVGVEAEERIQERLARL